MILMMIVATLLFFKMMRMVNSSFLVCLESILAIGAFAKRRAGNSTLKAFTVLLLALTCLAFATLEVHVLFIVNLALKGINVALQYLLHSFLPIFNMLIIVEALTTLTSTLTSWSTCGVVPQALTIELETLGILASATFALGCCRLGKEFILRDGLSYDFLSLHSDVLLVLVVLKLFFLLCETFALTCAMLVSMTSRETCRFL